MNSTRAEVHESKVQKSRLMENEGENSGSFTRTDSLTRRGSTEEGRETDKRRKWRVKHEQVNYTIKPVTRTSRFLFTQAADRVVRMKTNRVVRMLFIDVLHELK